MNSPDHYPLHFQAGHLFLEVDDEWWIVDTGAPTSFGTNSRIVLAGQEFSVAPNFLVVDASQLSEYISMECTGLLGMDILGKFDLLLDPANQILEVSAGELEFEGEVVSLENLMGLPVVTAQIEGRPYRMVFDTGAQISYFQHQSLREFPQEGKMTDFYPGFGQFETDIHIVEAEVGGLAFTLRCGTLPGLLGASFRMTGADGIIGNKILVDRRTGYSPRRNLLVL
jgi:hypothetical protein